MVTSRSSGGSSLRPLEAASWSQYSCSSHSILAQSKSFVLPEPQELAAAAYKKDPEEFENRSRVAEISIESALAAFSPSVLAWSARGEVGGVVLDSL